MIPQLRESREHLPECIRTSTTNCGMATPANKQCGLSSLSSVTVLHAVNSSDSEDVSDYDSDSDGEHSDILGGLQEREKQQQEGEFHLPCWV